MKGTENSISKKIISCILKPLALLLVLSGIICLSGCARLKITHPLGRGMLLEIDETGCTMGTAMARLLEARIEYENSEDEVLWIRTIGDITLSEYVKKTVQDEMMRYTAAQVMSRDLTVFISDEELANAERDASDLMEKLGSRYNMMNYSITYSDAEDLFIKRTYYNKVYEKLSENINMQISEADTKAIEISYVFIPAQDGVEIVEKMRNEMLGGALFQDVCVKYGYTPEINVTQTKGNMPAAFDNNAFALRDNEISEIVETRDGFYIIYCLEDYMVTESIANKNRIITEGKREEFRKAYEEFAQNATLRFNSAEWDKIDVSALE